MKMILDLLKGMMEGIISAAVTSKETSTFSNIGNFEGQSILEQL